MSDFQDVMIIRFRKVEKDGQQGHEIEIEFNPEFRKQTVMEQGPVMIGVRRSIDGLIDELSDKAVASLLVDAIMDGAKSPDEAKEMAIETATKRILDDEEPETVH